MSVNSIGGLSFRIAAVLICVTCIFYTTVMKSFNKKRLRGRLFIMLLSLTLIDCFTGIISTAVVNFYPDGQFKIAVTYVCKFIYYLTHMAFTPVLSIYIMMVCDVFHKLNKFTLFMFIFPFIVLEIAVLTNPFTEFIFSRNDGMLYARGNGLYIAYAISALYVLFCIFLLMRYWMTMNQLQKIAMFYFFVLAFAGTVVQMIYPDIVCELMGEALGLMGVMIMIEKDDFRLDYRTSANNRAALIHDLKRYIQFGRHFYIICVRIENAEAYRRLMGNDVYDFIMASGADFLREVDYRYETYRTTGGNFFILCPEATDNDIDIMLGKIEDRLNAGFKVAEGPKVAIRVLCARCPEEFQEVDDILLLADTEIEGDDKLILRGEDLGFLLRKVEVEKAIVRALNGDGFKVMYNPVFVKETGEVRSGEALLTLNDNLLGNIEFSEFMKVSDETGFVEELEYRMVEAVCRFVKEGIDKNNLYLNVIIVHIMSIQVLRTELLDKVKKCIEKYNIWSGRVVFSISDTIALQAQDIVKKTIDEFDEIGIKFALANHSAGLGGLDIDLVDRFIGISIDLKRHFDVIDIDQAESILKNRITMIRQLGKIVIVHGIDSEKYYNIIKELPVDLMCGQYLAGTITKEELGTRAGKREEAAPEFSDNKEEDDI